MKQFLLSTIALLAFTTAAHASPLVYTPVNPNFGGSPLNANIALNEANANNHYEKHFELPSANETLDQAIQNQVRYSLANTISQTLTSSTGSQTGSYVFTDGTRIEYSKANGLNTIVFINQDGSRTELTIPLN